jgi:hypothetical protein
LADEVVAGIDLPAIIRESTGSLDRQVMSDVRSQGTRRRRRIGFGRPN